MKLKLQPGDRVSFLQNGRKLKAIVVDHLNLDGDMKNPTVPVIRPRINGKCNADKVAESKPPKIRWIPRGELRKLRNEPRSRHADK